MTNTTNKVESKYVIQVMTKQNKQWIVKQEFEEVTSIKALHELTQYWRSIGYDVMIRTIEKPGVV